MKKALSAILVAATLASSIVIAPTSVSAEGSAKNVSAEVHYFGGSVERHVVEGRYTTKGGPAYAGVVDKVKTGDPSKGTLKLDGVIDEGEWGTPIAVVDSKYAPNNGNAKGVTNSKYEYPSAENTYFFSEMEKNAQGKNVPQNQNGLKYTLYLMWDEDYFYIAAETVDKDGLVTQKGDDTWNGDALQFRVDPLGANSIVGEGGTYDAKGMKGDDYNSYVKPWKDSPNMEQDKKANGERIGNFILTYSQSSMNNAECYDAGRRYKGANSGDPDSYWQRSVAWTTNKEGKLTLAELDTKYGIKNGAYGTILPTLLTPGENREWTMVYEYAIPWDLIGEQGKPVYKAEAGNKLGFAVALINAAAGKSALNSWLGWGTGVSDYQPQWDPKTCGGSNELILSAKSYKEAECTHDTFLPATCTEPETCAAEGCNYQRGYALGHTVEYKNVVLPEGGKDGTMDKVCSVCSYTEKAAIPAGDSTVKYAFATDAKPNSQNYITAFTDGFRTVWTTKTDYEKDADGAVKKYTDEYGSENVDKRAGVRLTNPDGSYKNAFDDTTFDGVSVFDLYSAAGNTGLKVDEDVTNGDQAGTYFTVKDDVNCTYGYTMDVYFPEIENEQWDHKYNSGLRHWFGRNDHFGFFGAGLYKIEDQYFFAIADAGRCEEQSITIEEFKKTAVAFTPATKADLAAKDSDGNPIWHKYGLYFNEQTATVMFSWDGVVKVAASDYHINYGNGQATQQPILRRFNVGCYLKDIKVGGTGLFTENAEVTSMTNCPSIPMPATVNGVEAEYGEGVEVQITAEYEKKDENGYTLRFSNWKGDADLLEDASVRETSFVMPDKAVTLEPEYKIVGDTDGDNKINPKDSYKLKAMIMYAVEPDKITGDINGDGKINTIDAFLLKKMLLEVGG